MITQGQLKGGTGVQDGGTYLLLIHGTDDGDQKIFSFFKRGCDLSSNVTFRDLDIVFGVAVISHEIKEAIINVDL